MVLKRLLLAYLVSLALLVWEPREVCSDSSNDGQNKLESIVHDELPFAQGLGLSSVASFHGDIAGGTQDIVELTPEKMPNYEAMIKRFFEEHLHIDEEARYCLEGSGYFDVRDEDDRWVRVSVRKGGLIVVPAGIYHRFTLDNNNYIKAMRLFSGSPDWTAYNRPHDHLPTRKKYLAALHNRREAQQDD